MRLIMWIMTITFSLAGLALRADHGAWLGLGPQLTELFSRGLLLLAALACPFLWARSYGLVPRSLQIPGKQRLMMGLALLLAVPLILPWNY